MPTPTARKSHRLMPDAQAMLPSAARTALREAAAALDRAERHRHPLAMGLALAQMARCYRALQAPEAAESTLEQALRWARTLGAQDQAVEILCQLAEAGAMVAEQCGRDGSRRGHAALERTRDRVFEAAALAGHASDPKWEIQVLLRVSDLLDRCGDHDDAVELQSRAMRMMYGPELGADPADPGADAAPAA
jgi:tetratricopeptide (TPR) repeat protein